MTHNLQKHRLNVLPEANNEDFAGILDSIKAGFDPRFPIILYEGAILDGWNRYRACRELGVEPVFEDFIGTEEEAIHYVMRTNKRRNLTSSQWATVAVESEDILRAIREDAERRMKAGVTDPGKQISQGSEEDRKTARKVAQVFNTNRTYVNQAARLRNEAPEEFARVKTGDISLSEAYDALRSRGERLRELEAILERCLPEANGVATALDQIATRRPEVVKRRWPGLLEAWTSGHDT